MAAYNKTIITAKGQALIAKSMVNTDVAFTRVVTSDKDYTSKGNLENLTSIENIKQSELVSEIKVLNRTAVQVVSAFSNSLLTTGYYLRTIGLYATDPDEGEILYSITTALVPDWIPPFGNISITSFEVKLETIVSNSGNIDLNVSPTAVVNVSQFKEFKEQVTTQLSESVQQIFKNTNPDYEYQDVPILIFIDDDTTKYAYQNWRSLAREKGINISMACITGKIGTDGYMTLEQLKEMYSAGDEVLCHGKDSWTITPNHSDKENELKEQLYDSRQWIIDNGFIRNEGYNILVYPQGNTGTIDVQLRAKQIARRWFKYGVNAFSNEFLKQGVFDSYNIPRITGDNQTSSYLTGKLDEVIGCNGIMVVLSHSAHMVDQDGGSYETWKQRYSDLIDYALANGVEIMTLGEAMKYRGNILNVGEFTNAKSVYINNDGSSTISSPFTISTNISDMDTDMSKIKNGTIKRINILTSHDSYLGTGGTLELVKGLNKYFSYAVYYPYNSNKIYKRRWMEDKTPAYWENFELVSENSPIIKNNLNGLMDNAISNYDTDKETTILIPTANDVLTRVGGTMKIFRSSQNHFSYALFYPAKSDYSYKRYWNDTTSSWGNWIATGTSSGTTANRPTAKVIGLCYIDTTLNKPIWSKGNYEVDTLTITAGTTTSGNITIILNGVSKTISVTAGKTSVDIATTIRGTVFSGWIVGGTSGTTIVIFTNVATGAKVIPTFIDTDSTGIKATFAVTTAGTTSTWIDATGIAL